MGCMDQKPATCAPGTVGQPYSMTIYLAPPDSGRGEDFDCARFTVSTGSLPPACPISDEGIMSGTPTQAGRYEFFLTVTYDKFATCTFKNPSDDSFIINVNAPAPRLVVTTPSLPDANINQAYPTALAASGGTVNSWTLASGTLPPRPDAGLQRHDLRDADAARELLFHRPGQRVAEQRHARAVDLRPHPTRFRARAQRHCTLVSTCRREHEAGDAVQLGRQGHGRPSHHVQRQRASRRHHAQRRRHRQRRADHRRSDPDDVHRAGRPRHDRHAQRGSPPGRFSPSTGTKQPKVGRVRTLYAWRLPVAGASETKIFLASGALPPGLSLNGGHRLSERKATDRGNLQGEVLGSRRRRDADLQDLSDQDPARHRSASRR